MRGFVYYIKKFNSVLFFVFAGIFFSCVDKVDLDPRERVVVVHSILVDSAVQSVKLNYTSFVSEDYCPPVTEAEVFMEKIKGGVPVERYNFCKVKDGIWQGEFNPKQLCTYKLIVIIPGKDSITAKTEYPLKSEWYRVDRRGRDYNNNNAETKSYNEYNHTRLRLYSFMDYNPEDGSYNISGSGRVSIRHWGGIPSDDYEEIQRNFRKRYWLFEDMEYYGCYAISRWKVHIASSDSTRFEYYDYKFKSSIVFVDYAAFEGSDLFDTVSFDAYFYYNKPNGRLRTAHPLSYLVVQSINKDYELYIKDLVAKSIGLNHKDVSDLTHIWEKDDIYSNVNNALGIFAAECRYEFMIKDWLYVGETPIWEAGSITIPGWNDK